MNEKVELINRDRNASFGLEFPLNGLVHSQCEAAGDPDFLALFAGLDIDIFKEIELSFNQAVNRGFSAAQFTAALSAQRIFHTVFSLLVLGFSHLSGANQWTVII